MKMRRVFVAWVVITLVMVTAAFAQRPEPRPPFMGMGVSNSCEVMVPGGRPERTLACRCYAGQDGFRCMVAPRSIMMRMDSMRMERRDSMREHIDRRPDSMRTRMRMHQDSVRMDSTAMPPRRMGPPRRP